MTQVNVVEFEEVIDDVLEVLVSCGENIQQSSRAIVNYVCGKNVPYDDFYVFPNVFCSNIVMYR